MIYTPEQYSKLFTINKKKVSAKTVIRRCEKGQLPTNHTPIRLTRIWLIKVEVVPQ